MAQTSPTRPICIQIAALGGQGGGVLSDWLDRAARIAGFPCQATSIPGVAQRTGATTYYVEIFPERDPPAAPVFCLFPDEGDLDLLASMEPMEAGRALQRELVGANTTVVTGTARVYATAEKMPAGDGTEAAGPVLDAVGKAAAKLHALDIEAIAADSGAQANAVLFGAMVGTGAMPVSADHCRQAVRDRGVAVEASLAGFEAGLGAVGGPTAKPDAIGEQLAPCPPGFDLGAWDPALQPLLGHCVARLVDYQDDDYARRFLDRLQPIAAFADQALTRETARRLAAWMAFEDVMRVAQLKTRPERLERIRGELRLSPDAPLEVVDYFRPGGEEVAGLLPPAFARFVPKAWPGFGLRIKTSGPVGWLSLKLLAAWRTRRPSSQRWAEEQAAIERWLSAIRAAAKQDIEIARRTAELGLLARGYGPVRARGMERLEKLFTNWENRLQREGQTLGAELDRLIEAARRNPDCLDD